LIVVVVVVVQVGIEVGFGGWFVSGNKVKRWKEEKRDGE
jgi:hypothetical protein